MLSYDAPSSHLNGQGPTSPTTPQAVVSGVQSASMNTRHMNGTLDHDGVHHIWLVTGPAGCGKTTVAQHIADEHNMPYIEGDEFHPKANIEKMAKGIPLTDADRWDWLTALREESRRRIAGGAEGVVLTCSALKRKYRDVIRVAGYYDHSLRIHFIFLHADESVLVERVKARSAATNHYMGANMVSSQFSILELPGEDEKDVITLDVSKTMPEVQQDALNSVEAIIGEAR